MKTISLLILGFFFLDCSNKTELDNYVDPDMKATLRDYINDTNEFPVYLYSVNYKENSQNNRILLDSTTNKQISLELPYIIANKKRYDIRKIWGMREAKKETIPTKLITTELKIEFMK
ncbi:hypothetical protein LV89_01136 [Arcicella aurantiaca]|uniref:Uncharacterized protein n=1 Tax=Arcicella aurantiaca TaxID=591202 RepID=A0A316EF80_9BACT|nr:hypothetical protein [Arcicella aurantiaca]PWK28352.1 hypothetical protein LV89_01136 [Arcicella aurantiaca]